jgi:hypothetical protein
MGRRILVQWSAVRSTPPVTRYEAECRKGSGPITKRFATGRATFIAAESRGNYRCRVRAQNKTGWSAWSKIATVTVR